MGWPCETHLGMGLVDLVKVIHMPLWTYCYFMINCHYVYFALNIMKKMLNSPPIHCHFKMRWQPLAWTVEEWLPSATQILLQVLSEWEEPIFILHCDIESEKFTKIIVFHDVYCMCLPLSYVYLILYCLILLMTSHTMSCGLLYIHSAIYTWLHVKYCFIYVLYNLCSDKNLHIVLRPIF